LIYDQALCATRLPSPSHEDSSIRHPLPASSNLPSPNHPSASREQPIAGTTARTTTTQPGLLFRLMTPEQKQTLFDNTARAMRDAPEEIKLRHIANCVKADPAYGVGVAMALGISMGELVEKA